MILTSIELINIRSYEKEKIHFPLGITLFEGDIGSGKSTVLMGIEFALFGLGSQKPEALLSKKANEGTVILNFEANGQKCEVKRTLKRKGDAINQDPKQSYLKINEEHQPLSPTELKQKILQILDFNEPGDPRSESKIFRYAVFTPQEEMKQILNDALKRVETIRRAFGVEDYKIASENAKNILSFIDKHISIFRERFKDILKYESELEFSNIESTKINLLIKSLESKENILKRQNHDLEKEIDEIREKILHSRELSINKQNHEEKLRDKKYEYDKTIKQLKEIKDEINQSRRDEEIYKKIVKPTTKSLQKINEEMKYFSELKTEIIFLQSKKNHLLDEVEKLQKQIETHSESERKEVRNYLQTLREKLKQQQIELGKVVEEIKIDEKEKNKIEINIENSKNSLAKITKIGTKCHYCERELTSEQKENLEKVHINELNDAKIKLKIISDQVYSKQSESTRLKTEILNSEMQVKNIETLVIEIENYSAKNNELKEVENQLNKIQVNNVIPEEENFPNHGRYEDPLSYLSGLKDSLVQFQNSEDRMLDIQKNIERLVKLETQNEQDMKTKENEIKNINETLIEISIKLKSFEGIEIKIKNLQESKTFTDKEIKNISESILLNKQKYNYEQDTIKELSKKIENAQTWKNVHKKYSNYYEWLKEFFIPTLNQIEKQVLLSIQQDFNEIYRRWYSILIDDPTKESRIDENFTPIIEQDSYEQDVNFLSGGEKTSIALAYRLTLNSLMRRESNGMKTNLLLLDEPTDGFSKTQLAKVRTLLLELKSQQVILVSHEKELETYVDNIFHVNKESGISRIVRLNN